MAKLARFNWISFLSMLCLIALGTVAIHSAGQARTGEVFREMWVSNLATAGFGLAVYFALAFSDYRRLLAWTAVPMYVFAISVLVAVLAFGSTVYGGRRWLWFFQPSEISKLCVICAVARMYGGDGLFESIRTGFGGFAAGAAMLALPCVLILLEPDLGTTLVLIPSVLLMLFAARVWRRGLVAVLLTLSVAAVAVLGLVYEAERPGAPPGRREAIMKFVPLKDHQIKRVRVFLFPEEDIHGAGYTLRQAKISIGSGGLTGRGLRKARSNMLKYLPESISMNDFIFCVYAEETGFAGSIALLSLAGLLLLSCAWTAHISTDGCGRLLALGVTALLFAHFFVNIAMSLGMVPITGLPLPFISAGRTFLLTAMSGLGLVQSVSIHGRETTK